jgi:Tfp pilus assembly protein PilF
VANWRTILLVILLAAVLPAFPQEAAVPDEAAAAAERGRQFFAQEQYAAALTQLEQALAAGRRDGRTLYMAARCQEKTRKPRGIVVMTVTEAIPALEAAVKKPSADLTDHAFMSGAYSLAGNDPAARGAGRNGVAAYKSGRFGSLETMDDTALADLGKMALLAEDWALAGECLNLVVDHALAGGDAGRTRAAGALLALGRGQLKAGRPDEAAALIRRSLELRPDDSDTLVALAGALFKGGDYAGAAEQWQNVRLNDVSRANDAVYAAMIMLTLSQEKNLRNPDRPLEDLTSRNRGELEDQMLALAGQMGTLAGQLPENAVKRGYSSRSSGPETRRTMKEFRDLKLRLAWVGAAYIDRGIPIREFAFSRGLQGFLRNWRPLTFHEGGESEELDLDWLNEAQRDQYLAQVEARKAKQAQREEKRDLRREKRGKREKGTAGDS